MSKYILNKSRVEALAADWQANFSTRARSWSYCITWADRFYKIGKKYGLIKIFKNNGII